MTFSEPVNAPATAFTLSCNTVPVEFVLTGGPTTFTVDPAAALPVDGDCVLAVGAAAVSDVDRLDPPYAMAADHSIAFIADNACGLAFTPIAALQGAGATTPMADAVVTTEGVVVGDYELIAPAGPGTGSAASMFRIRPATAIRPPPMASSCSTGTATTSLLETSSV